MILLLYFFPLYVGFIIYMYPIHIEVTRPLSKYSFSVVPLETIKCKQLFLSIEKKKGYLRVYTKDAQWFAICFTIAGIIPCISSYIFNVPVRIIFFEEIGYGVVGLIIQLIVSAYAEKVVDRYRECMDNPKFQEHELARYLKKCRKQVAQEQCSLASIKMIPNYHFFWQKQYYYVVVSNAGNEMEIGPIACLSRFRYSDSIEWRKC